MMVRPSPDMALRRRLYCVAISFVAAIVLMVGSALPAWAAEAMTLTFIRHGESQANAAGVIDTSVPGPHITELGRQQAVAVADALVGSNYDGIYASSMIRTQETAQPLADRLGQSIVILPGVREIGAGVFEGQSEDSGLGRIGYALAPAAWVLGARFVPVLGATDGNAFDARVDDSIQLIYDSGDRNAAVFSHGATIMFWTMMNVENPDLVLLLTHQLDNTDVVVITGNPEDGWTLVNWDGVAVSAEPSLVTKLFVDVRDVVTAPQTALYRIGQSFANGDIAGLAKAVRDGVVDVATNVIRFVPDVVHDIVGSLRASAGSQSVPDAPTDSATVQAARDDDQRDNDTVETSGTTTELTNRIKPRSGETPAGSDDTEAAVDTTDVEMTGTEMSTETGADAGTETTMETGTDDASVADNAEDPDAAEDAAAATTDTSGSEDATRGADSDGSSVGATGDTGDTGATADGAERAAA